MKNIRKKTFITLWVLLSGILLTALVFLILIFNGAIGYMPNLSQLENPVNKFASQVYTSDGKLIGTWSYSTANRTFVSYDQLSPWTVKALISTEDERFYDHCGIDFRALGRAIVKRGFMGQKEAGGGSTLTQQLAKQLYSEKAEGTTERLLQKPIEWVIALKLERYYTKEEIIMLYLNYFDFLHNAVGIRTAAKTYFNKEPRDLTINESAMLVGMCKNPSYYNPMRDSVRAEERRNMVLSQMVRSGYLTPAQYDSCKAEPLKLNFTRVDQRQGEGTYLREYLRQIMMAEKPNPKKYQNWQRQKFIEDSVAWETDPLYGWCNKNFKKDGSSYNLYTDGLKIYTAIDSRMQYYAEEAMQEHVAGYLQPIFLSEHPFDSSPYAYHTDTATINRNMNRSIRQCQRYVTMKAAGIPEDSIMRSFHVPVEMTLYSSTGEIERTMTPYDSILYYKHFLRSAFMCMDNHTGEVKAYVGGLDYTHFQYDMVSVGRRQIGSTAKPYLYSLAMEGGYTPCSTVPDVRRSYDGWTPKGGGSGAMVTLKHALTTSNNTVSAFLINDRSPAQFVEMLRLFGIVDKQEVKEGFIKPIPQLCLGSYEISLAKMVAAYTAFPNKGVRRLPIFVTRIVDSEGNVLADLTKGLPPRSKEVIKPESSYRMISLMRSVVNHGTGTRMRGYVQCPMGGKTGTTNNNSDGWFVGYTPSLTFGAWVGGEERDIHFASTGIGQGAASALPICGLFLRRVFRDSRLGYDPNEQFDIPKDFDECNDGLGEASTKRTSSYSYGSKRSVSSHSDGGGSTGIDALVE